MFTVQPSSLFNIFYHFSAISSICPINCD